MLGQVCVKNTQIGFARTQKCVNESEKTCSCVFRFALLTTSYLALPRKGQLEQVLHMVGYLEEHKKMKLMFDSSKPFTDDDGLKNMIGLICIVTRKNQPEARGLDVSISAFVDANLAGN